MEQTVICLLMVQKFINLQQKIMIIPNNLCLGNVSKDFSAHNMKKKKQDLMVTFMILVLMIIQLMLKR